MGLPMWLEEEEAARLETHLGVPVPMREAQQPIPGQLLLIVRAVQLAVVLLRVKEVPAQQETPILVELVVAVAACMGIPLLLRSFLVRAVVVAVTPTRQLVTGKMVVTAAALS